MTSEEFSKELKERDIVISPEFIESEFVNGKYAVFYSIEALMEDLNDDKYFVCSINES